MSILVLCFLAVIILLDVWIVARFRSERDAANAKANTLRGIADAALAKADAWRLAAMTLGDQFQKHDRTIRAVHAALSGDPSTASHDPDGLQPDPEL